jgi:hypothetical protein
MLLTGRCSVGCLIILEKVKYKQGRGRMKKHFLWMICLGSLAFCNGTFAEEFQKYSFSSVNAKWDVELEGPFSKPSSIQAGKFIITYAAQHKNFLDMYEAGAYYFVGRTGEKTFQVRYSVLSYEKAYNKNEVINLYLGPNEPFEFRLLGLEVHLPFIGLEQGFKLKLIALKGNKLVCQVIIPEEWKSYLGKK